MCGDGSVRNPMEGIHVLVRVYGHGRIDVSMGARVRR